jgi:hypothetical protein
MEILFRGKTIPECIGWDDEKEEEIYSECKWIYGGYGEIYGTSYIMTASFMKHITAGGSRWMDEEINAIKVQSKTVGQYTQTIDKNKNKIFDGDIIKYETTKGLVLFSKTLLAWMVGIRDEYGIKHEELYDNMYTIIGNIHDNPNLLKEIK